MKFHKDWTQEDDQKLKDTEECGEDIICFDCTQFEICNYNSERR